MTEVQGHTDENVKKAHVSPFPGRLEGKGPPCPCLAYLDWVQFCLEAGEVANDLQRALAAWKAGAYRKLPAAWPQMLPVINHSVHLFAVPLV